MSQERANLVTGAGLNVDGRQFWSLVSSLFMRIFSANTVLLGGSGARQCLIEDEALKLARYDTF